MAAMCPRKGYRDSLRTREGSPSRAAVFSCAHHFQAPQATTGTEKERERERERAHKICNGGKGREVFLSVQATRNAWV